MLFLKEVFPHAPQIQLTEFYYRISAANIGFDPEFDAMDFEDQVRVRVRRAPRSLPSMTERRSANRHGSCSSIRPWRKRPQPERAQERKSPSSAVAVSGRSTVHMWPQCASSSRRAP